MERGEVSGIKVFILNSDIGYGSTGKIVRGIARTAREAGYDVKLGYGREIVAAGKEERKDMIKIGFRIDVYLHVLLTRLFDLQGFGSYFATRRFIWKLKKYDPDLIHIHNLHGSYIHIKLLFKYIQKYDKTVIWTLHDCFAYTGHCAHYTSAGCLKWRNGCSRCPQKNVYPASYFLDRSCQNFCAKKKIFGSIEKMTVVTVSQWLKHEAEQSFLGSYPIRVISNGIDLTVFCPTVSDFRKIHHLENRKIVLGVSSVWNEGKGISLFNQLAQQLDAAYQVVLVGVTKKKRKMFSPQILCIERTENQKELAAIYSQADVFINASREESFGLVVVEALACGTQVVTNSDSANPELVEECCGMVLKEYSVQSYIDAVEWLTAHPKKAEDCVNRALHYSEDGMYRKYMELYEEVI